MLGSTMAQPSSLTLNPPPELRNCSDGPSNRPPTSPKGESGFDWEAVLEQTEVYPGYEGYIENGLICLKHKVRNLEKKKLKLEEYKLRLKQGLKLNKDQLASVEKYEEVLHHLSLARDLRRTLDSLTQNLLRAQRKAVKNQQAQRAELERSRLCSVLQFQHVLLSLDIGRVQSDLVSGLNQAPKVQPKTLQSLRQLMPLLGLRRDNVLSVSEQMERAAGLFLDLLDGKDAPVADSTFESLKEELCVLVASPYFNSLPVETESHKGSSTDSDVDAVKSDSPQSSKLKKSKTRDPPVLEPCPVLVQAWDADCEFLKDQETPDCWDMRYTGHAQDEGPNIGKPWKGGAALVLKDLREAGRPGEGKRERKVRKEEPFKPMPMEVLTLPTDPELRRQRLEELLTNVNGAFSFMQDSVLDGDGSPSGTHHRLRRRVSGCPSPLGKTPSPLSQSDLKRPHEQLPNTLTSTPLVGSNPKPSITNGDQSLDSRDLDSQDVGQMSSGEMFSPVFCTESSASAISHKRPLQVKSPVSVKPPLSQTSPTAYSFMTPPSRRALPPAHFNNMHAVPVSPAMPPAGFYRPGFSCVSTQTPPEFDTSDEDSHEAGWRDMSLGSTMDLEPLDSGHGASPLISSFSVEGSLLPHPLRVAFSASRTANFAPGNLDQPIVFDQLHSNTGEMYDPRIGRFTCPVDGTYVFNFHILKLAINVPLYVNLMRNEEVMVSAYANDSTPDHETASNHAILPLFCGDQVWLRLHRGAIYGSTWKYTTFSGFLLYQD